MCKYIKKKPWVCHTLNLLKIRREVTLNDDEYHLILICPTYRDLRKKFIKKYYWSNPSVYIFAQLLSANNVRDLCNLGKYIKKHLKRDLLTSSTYMYNCYIYWFIVLIFGSVYLLYECNCKLYVCHRMLSYAIKRIELNW